MKKILTIIALFLCFAGCEYPQSDMDGVNVDVTTSISKPTKTVTLQTQITNPDNMPIMERGFCYAGYGSVSCPNVGLNKHIVDGTDFTWNVGEEMSARVAYVRAYIIVDGIVIYSERMVDMGLLYANAGL